MIKYALVTALALFTTAALHAADDVAVVPPDGNVWLSDDAGRHFTCPISGKNDVITEKTSFVDWEGKRYYFCCPGCDAQFQKDPRGALDKHPVPMNVTAASGDKLMVTCPVSGERVVVGNETKFQDYDGHRYYFCCANCARKFVADPAKYSADQPAE